MPREGFETYWHRMPAQLQRDFAVNTRPLIPEHVRCCNMAYLVGYVSALGDAGLMCQSTLRWAMALAGQLHARPDLKALVREFWEAPR